MIKKEFKIKTMKGFTLVELVTTIVIVGIMAVVAVPRFFSTSAYQSQVFHDQIISSIRYARKLAIATSNHYQMSVNSTAFTIQQRIEGSACNTGVTFQPITDPTNRGNGYVKTAPGDMTLTYSSDWPLYFDGLGRVYRASDCTQITTATISVSGAKTITLIGETGFSE